METVSMINLSFGYFWCDAQRVSKFQRSITRFQLILHQKKLERTYIHFKHSILF